jgi:hypothetical protein
MKSDSTKVWRGQWWFGHILSKLTAVMHLLRKLIHPQFIITSLDISGHGTSSLIPPPTPMQILKLLLWVKRLEKCIKVGIFFLSHILHWFFFFQQTFDAEPTQEDVNYAIVECLEGSEREDEIVAQQMQAALEAGQLNRVSEILGISPSDMVSDLRSDTDDYKPFQDYDGKDWDDLYYDDWFSEDSVWIIQDFGKIRMFV